jgi:hypothetical protein
VVVLVKFVRRAFVTRETLHRPHQRGDDRERGDQEPSEGKGAPQSALAGCEDGPVTTRSDHHHEHGPPIDD